MKWVRRTILIVFALAALVAIVLALRAKPVPIETTKIEKGQFDEYVEEPSRTRVRQRFVVSAPVTGDLARIALEPGDPVEPGSLLATIRPMTPEMHDVRTKTELEARLQGARAALTLSSSNVEKAKAVLSFNDKELARIRGLVDKGTLPGRDLDKAELDLRVAQKDLRSAELSARVAAHDVEVAKAAQLTIDGLGKSESGLVVNSPLRGRVLRVMQTSAGVVQVGTALLEVADTTDHEVLAPLLTNDALRVRVGAPATLERWGGEPLLARVRKIEPSGYTKLSALGVEEQRVDVMLDIVSPPDKWTMLGDGFRVHAKILVHSEPAAVKTAAAALFRDGDAWAVFVVDAGRARKRRVTVERRNGPEAMLGPDAPLGATLVNFPTNEIADGTKVVVQ
jgi:HlyD family secretion protein